jgi:hypothetical protein
MMTKSNVIQLQRALRENVAPGLVVDGAWGTACDVALGSYAVANALTVGAAKELLFKYAEVRYVSDDAFDQAANALGVPESYVRAVAEVETNGESFLKDGNVKILFERHWFKRKLGDALSKPAVRESIAKKMGGDVPAGSVAIASLLKLVESKYPNICSSVRGGYSGGSAEWTRLNTAMDLDVEAAAQATSFGGYQLMGFNHSACGYETATAMMLDMAKSESVQFLAMVSFIKANQPMHTALKRGDWAKFAEYYNGSAFMENAYNTKLAKAQIKYIEFDKA